MENYPYIIKLAGLIRQCGHYSIARRCYRVGLPIETVLHALRIANHG